MMAKPKSTRLPRGPASLRRARNDSLFVRGPKSDFKGNKMSKRILPLVAVSLICCNLSYSRWIEISNTKVTQELTELGGPRIVIEYDINDPEISKDCPAYVFIRYSKDSSTTWEFLAMEYLRGKGYGLVESPGHKKNVWWGTSETSFREPGETGETHIVDLSRMKFRAGWNKRMSDSRRCGIVQNGSAPNFTYSVKPGIENYPVTYVSWYDAVAFLRWCGLRLPSEAEWEKALRGGIYLDGDKTKQRKNPLPERKYPWGNESPNAEGAYRCNYDGKDDGFGYTAPVGSFDKFNSPYGGCDMAGNVAEWTLDWYSTSYHVGLDGFRMVRGGSWMAVPFACDAITGATQFPLKESSIMGLRGSYGTRQITLTNH